VSVDTQIAARVEPEYRALGDFLRGAAAMLTSPLVITPVGMSMGFGALAHDTGFSIVWTALTGMLMFGVPGQILLVTGINHDAALLTIAVAVTLSAVRYAPMVATLLSLMRFPGVRTRHVFFPVHCTVASLWLEVLRRLPGLPNDRRRVAFCNGLAAAIFVAATLATVAGYYLAGAMPPLFAAALLFVTPISFLVGTASSSKTLVDKLALTFGLGLAAAAWLLGATFNMLWIGVIAGSVAYGIQRMQRR
jgi:predicted branched-subunit amino acid permease